MKILCIICHDLLIPTEDIFFTHCGHVFHHRCLSQWFERSKTCPQCRARTAEDRIHKAHFTVSNTEDNEDNLQGRIDSLKFQVLLNERNIKHYISKNAVLEKQNAGLRLEVRKVESEIRQKNSNIYALKDEIRYFKEKHQEYEVLKKELSEKKREVKQFRDIYKTLSTSTLDDMQDIIRETTDRNTLMNYIFVMKKIMSKKTRTINYLQGQLLRHRGSLEEERSKKVDFEVRSAHYKRQNLILQHRVNELEKLFLLNTIQNYVTESNSRKKFYEKFLIRVKANTYIQVINLILESAVMEFSFGINTNFVFCYICTSVLST
ncbi:PREDICTED: E3 ubiquitin-protein ligase TRAIP-like isoform X1 [Wasmannia auropunctata]|uniref:E3 ubiquitin-protein ligase TRAIP-like isoform X1 n=1 Tax=Wasmannia auropunctata TaxID=64793 RepID=UPI0005EEC1D8|nr:PREDICTED: E3 ubiquitin-protein ligase TRAIP-like isoform X1 [Wasmannia auropunctata]